MLINLLDQIKILSNDLLVTTKLLTVLEYKRKQREKKMENSTIRSTKSIKKVVYTSKVVLEFGV